MYSIHNLTQDTLAIQKLESSNSLTRSVPLGGFGIDACTALNPYVTLLSSIVFLIFNAILNINTNTKLNINQLTILVFPFIFSICIILSILFLETDEL